MADFLLELLSEEIPARMQAKARNDLARLFAEATGEAGLTTGAVETHSTPRRLVLIARGVAEATEAGTRGDQGSEGVRAAAGARGIPRKHGLHTETSSRSATASTSRSSSGPGGRRRRCFAGSIKRIVADFPWPKSMRWGERRRCAGCGRCTGSSRMLGEDIVPVEVGRDRQRARRRSATASTIPAPITIGGASRLCREIARLPRDRRPGRARAADPRGRGESGRGRRAGAAARRGAGGRECRADRMAGAAARPVRPRLSRRAARGDRADHAHQPEIFRLRGRGRRGSRRRSCASPTSTPTTAARRSSRAMRGCSRRGWPTRASSGSRIVKVPLEEQAKKLGGIVFHEKLGTVADKVERVAKLARWLVEEGIVPLPSTREAGEVDLPAAARSPLSQGRGELADRPSAPRGWPRPTSSPAWSASSPSCRA